MTKPDFPAGIAIVIGGSGGVGSAICAALARAGTDVALTYRSNRPAAEAAAAQCVAAGREAHVRQLDNADSGAVTRVIDDLIAEYGPLHSLIYAAGPHVSQRLVGELDRKSWHEVFDNDVHGFFNLVQTVLPHLRDEGGGSLVVISTVGLTRCPTRDILSLAPKAAVEALMNSVAREEGRFNVRANSIRLGVIEAGMFERLRQTEFNQQWIKAARANTALKRFGQAEEVANVAVFLASSSASYVTGQVLNLDGGYSL